jgi:uncharacterized membrane protein YvbJ
MFAPLMGFGAAAMGYKTSPSLAPIVLFAVTILMLGLIIIFSCVYKKFEILQNFIEKLSEDKNSVGLYMKNVNKYYLFTKDSYFNILNELKSSLNLEDSDLEQLQDYQTSLNMVDLGKCEASLIFQD